MSRVFRSRLASLARLRERLEDERTRALAEAVMDHAARAARADSLERGTRAERGRLVASGVAGAPGRVLGPLAEHVQALVEDTRGAQAELRDADARVGAARVALIAAVSARRSVERLIAHQRAAHDREMLGREQRELEDVATARWAAAPPGRWTAHPVRDGAAR
jgi:flagellar export protein FliJ